MSRESRRNSSSVPEAQSEVVQAGKKWWHKDRAGMVQAEISVGGRRRVRAGEMALVKLNLRAAHRGGT